MHFETYDPVTGTVLESFSELNFGDMIQNQHCLKPVVIRIMPDQETGISHLKLYLEDKGPWKDTNFGYFLSEAFVPSIESGSSFFDHFFTEVPNATSSSDGSVQIGWYGTASDYIWLDAHIHNVAGSSEANFRLFFDHF